MAYLDEHPPARSQMRCPRREDPSGVIVVHTAESILDQVGGDHGAENVAFFIAMRRDAPGSYHELADADSTVQVVEWTCEAYQDGTGSNRHAMGLSFALRTTDWRRLSPERRAATLRNGARRAAAYARWVKARYGITIPARRITREQSERRVPGFIGHGERDPGRRTDPGADFPWDEFLRYYAEEMGATPPDQEDDDVRDQIIFFATDPGAAGSNHAYRCTGMFGHYLDEAGLNAARYIGVPVANDSAKPWPTNVRATFVLLDGPLRNADT